MCDALRSVFLMGASEPEHCRRVQILVSGLLELPGNRTWEFVIWNAKQGWGQLGEGDGARSAGRCPTAVYGPISGRGTTGRDIWAGRMWKCGEFVAGPGESATERWFTLRSAGIQARNDGLLHHRMHADAGSAGPASLEPRSGQGDPGVWDALRFVFQGSSSEPEHSRLVQIVISKLPGMPGNRTWEFVIWSATLGMGQLVDGAARRQLRYGYGPGVAGRLGARRDPIDAWP